MPSTTSITPEPELTVRLTVPFFCMNVPPTGCWMIIVPAGMYSDCTVPLVDASRVLSSIILIASSLFIPSTSGAIAIFSGISILVVYLEKFITPVSRRTPNAAKHASSAGMPILAHSGQLYRSIFFIFPYTLFAGVSLSSSRMNAVTVGVLSSILTFIAFSSAFSLFTEMFLFSLCGSGRISLLLLSYCALRSIASGGVCPVIILYSVAASAYTSVCGPWSPILLYCSSGEYPGLIITVRLRLCDVVAYLAAPKSISLISPVLVIKILSGAISLWISPASCTVSSERITGISISTALSSSITPFSFRYSASVSPSRYSITI